MNSVREYLKSIKDRKPLLQIAPHDTVAYAIRLMSENDLGALVVSDHDEIVGLFSERDYARKLLLENKSSLITPVHEVMVTKVVYVTQDFLLDECMALMTKKKIRHLPVLDNGKVIDVLTIDEVAEALLNGKEFIISELTKYITGSPIYNFPERRINKTVELIWSNPRSVNFA